MFRKFIAVSALSGLAACGGGEFLFPTDGNGGGTTGDPTTPGTSPGTVVDPISQGVPDSLAKNLKSINFNPGNDTITVEIASLDTTPLTATYARRPSLDINGYTAFAVQEDSLDRLFVALVDESDDGSVKAGVVGDGGQFGRFFSGGYYTREGAFNRPVIGTGPGAGQVSYAGNYAALVNGGGDGSELLPVPSPGTVDPVLLPRQPGQISGSIFINANFADNSVNGAVYDRILVDTGLTLDSIILLPTDIAANGTFLGNVEYEGQRQDIGDYGGIFGGTGAAGVGGLIALTEFSDGLENENELGVFVLTKCGLPNDAVICDNVAPF